MDPQVQINVEADNIVSEVLRTALKYLVFKANCDPMEEDLVEYNISNKYALALERLQVKDELPNSNEEDIEFIVCKPSSKSKAPLVKFLSKHESILLDDDFGDYYFGLSNPSSPKSPLSKNVEDDEEEEEEEITRL